MLYDVFLSHASDDNGLAKSIADILQEAGLRVFCTVPGHPAGLWRDEVRIALEQSEWFWLLLTENALSNTYVHNELGYFYGYQRRKLLSTDILVVGRKVRYILVPGTPVYGMYEHFQSVEEGDFNPVTIANIILRETGGKGKVARARSPIPFRQLVNRAQYAEAIEEMTRQIEGDPAEHTKYLARARAKYFKGDIQGMWEDVAEAERLKPGDRQVQNFRKSVLEGTLSPGGSRPVHQDELEKGNAHLARGEWEQALAVYRSILPYGISYHLSIAMAFICGNNIPAAEEALGIWERYVNFNPRDRIHGFVLRALITTLQNGDTTSVWKELQSALARTPNFNLRRSPLRHLQFGLARTRVLRQPGARRIFDVLPGNDVSSLLEAR